MAPNIPDELWGLATEAGELLRHLLGSYHAYPTRLEAEGAAARLAAGTDDHLTPVRIEAVEPTVERRADEAIRLAVGLRERLFKQRNPAAEDAREVSIQLAWLAGYAKATEQHLRRREGRNP